MIYHITTRSEWQTAQATGHYAVPALQREGFIHCSTAAQVVRVGNAFYREVPDCVLLCIEPKKLTSPVQWEAPAHPDPDNPPPVAAQELFPHIYGPLNLAAVVRVVDFMPGKDGRYTLPEGVE